MRNIDDDFLLIDMFEEEIKFFINSDYRLKIFTSLYNTPSTLKLLHEKVDLSYTSITHNISRMTENKIVRRNNDLYQLYNQTKFKLLCLLLLENNFDFLYKFTDFLNNHKVKNDKLKLLSILPYMRNTDLIQASNINPDITVEMYGENIISGGTVKSLFIYLHPKFPEIISYMMGRPSDFEVIVPPYLSEFIKSYAREYNTGEPLLNKRFNVMVVNNLKIALVVSPHKIVLGLVRKEGKFNKNCILVSNETNAVDWGYGLFREYRYLVDDKISVKNLILENSEEMREV